MARRRTGLRGVEWLAVLAACLIAARAPEALAHAGHDHGPNQVPASVAPRFEAASDDFEVLAVLKGAELSVTLDRFRTNEPVAGATIEATVNGDKAVVEAIADGTYLIRSSQLSRPGRAEVLLTIVVGDQTDLLAGAVEVPSASVAPTQAKALWQRLLLQRDIIAAAVIGFMAGVLMVLLMRRPTAAAPEAVAAATDPATEPDASARRVQSLERVSLILLVVAAGLGLPTPPDSRAAEPSKVTITADLPQRLPDGSLFVPKITQRLLSIRTVLAGQTAAGATIDLNGQIVPDPNGFGRVQAPVDGRIDAPASGLVVIGQTVERGQALAVLTPIIPTADRSTFESAIGEIETRVALAEQKLARLSRIPTAVAQKDIDDTRTELESLRTRRAAVRSAIREPITLTAPVAGVVSVSSAIPGQLASARETIFEIVDPSRLWVEAIAYDARLAADITAARASIGGGESLSLEYIGRGIAARQQGVPLNFRIVAPPGTLSIGKPVIVTITTRETRQGLILPQAAVVKGQNGLSIVWTHTQAERFKPNVVKVRPIDGHRLLVEGGLAANERVVVDGATLLNQVR